MGETWGPSNSVPETNLAVLGPAIAVEGMILKVGETDCFRAGRARDADARGSMATSQARVKTPIMEELHKSEGLQGEQVPVETEK